MDLIEEYGLSNCNKHGSAQILHEGDECYTDGDVRRWQDCLHNVTGLTKGEANAATVCSVEGRLAVIHHALVFRNVEAYCSSDRTKRQISSVVGYENRIPEIMCDSCVP